MIETSLTEKRNQNWRINTQETGLWTGIKGSDARVRQKKPGFCLGKYPEIICVNQCLSARYLRLLYRLLNKPGCGQGLKVEMRGFAKKPGFYGDLGLEFRDSGKSSPEVSKY